MSKRTKKTKKTKRKGKRGTSRVSRAMRGAARRNLGSTHVGVDFPEYMSARGFAMKAKAALKMKAVPEVRKVESKKASYKYVVVLPKGTTPKTITALLKKKSSGGQGRQSVKKGGK